ncbi:hypothetical protein GGP41_002803 [Bipolaris sorokiniana]|uniref:Uncharacterized protein n=1 Tax=Cochliobolus sativus TaxID=45130 RepID=A0A8H5Z9Q6_COCSA|nr:hypothetical protein GGP41_002803 [Bipolaris sorokiniana]
MIIDLNKILLLLAAAGTIHAGIIRANEDYEYGLDSRKNLKLARLSHPFSATQICRYAAMVMTPRRTNAGCVALHGMVVYPNLMEQPTALKNQLFD